jgi:hypothetical protein
VLYVQYHRFQQLMAEDSRSVRDISLLSATLPLHSTELAVCAERGTPPCPAWKYVRYVMSYCCLLRHTLNGERDRHAHDRDVPEVITTVVLHRIYADLDATLLLGEGPAVMEAPLRTRHSDLGGRSWWDHVAVSQAANVGSDRRMRL